MSSRTFLLAGGLSLACATASGAVQTQKLPDGTVHITCQTSLQKCLDSATTLCKGASYDILRAREQRDRLGGELGQSNVELRSSEALIHCAGSGEPAPSAPVPEPTPEPTWKLPTPTAPPTPPAIVAPSAPPPERACVPGATQACVGPGACQGGQACLPSGAAFGPCDCGPLPPASSSPPPKGP